MNGEDVVRLIAFFWFDISGVGTSSVGSLSKVGTLIVKVPAHCQRPCADLGGTVGSPVDVDTVSYLISPVWPRCFSITHPLALGGYIRNDGLAVVGEPLLPCDRTLIASLLVGDLDVRNGPVAYIVTALDENATTTCKVLCAGVVLASGKCQRLLFACDGNITRFVGTREITSDALLDRTLDLDGDGVRRIRVQGTLFDTRKLELDIVERIYGFLAVEIDTFAGDYRDAFCSRLASPATIPGVRSNCRVVNFHIDYLISLYSQETCHESKQC